jgi:hypothetical protein
MRARTRTHTQTHTPKKTQADALDELNFALDEESDDGEGGRFTLHSGSDVAKVLGRSRKPPARAPTGDKGQTKKSGGNRPRQVKKLIMDAPEMEDIWQVCMRTHVFCHVFFCSRRCLCVLDARSFFQHECAYVNVLVHEVTLP